MTVQKIEVRIESGRWITRRTTVDG